MPGAAAHNINENLQKNARFSKISQGIGIRFDYKEISATPGPGTYKNPDTVPPMSYHYPSKFNKTVLLNPLDEMSVNFNTVQNTSVNAQSMDKKLQELAVTQLNSVKKHPFGAPSNHDLASHMILFTKGSQPPMAFGKATL